MLQLATAKKHVGPGLPGAYMLRLLTNPRWLLAGGGSLLGGYDGA